MHDDWNWALGTGWYNGKNLTSDSKVAAVVSNALIPKHWFFDEIDEEKADKLLGDKKTGSFLIRRGESVGLEIGPESSPNSEQNSERQSGDASQRDSEEDFARENLSSKPQRMQSTDAVEGQMPEQRKGLRKGIRGKQMAPDKRKELQGKYRSVQQGLGEQKLKLNLKQTRQK